MRSASSTGLDSIGQCPRLRDECLNINSFWSLAQARVVISDWKDEYNHRRRHSALSYQTPARYAATCIHR